LDGLTFGNNHIFAVKIVAPRLATADWTTLILKADKQGWTVLIEW